MFKRLKQRLKRGKRKKKLPEKKLPETFCVLPWIQTHISTSGAVSPCCEFEGEIANLSDSTLSDGWQSAALGRLRESFLKGEQPQPCRKCYEREETGEYSLRKQANSNHSAHRKRIGRSPSPLQAATDFPIALDLRFSNLCNFKCRSCWHGASSKWFTDGQALGVTVGEKAIISSFRSAEDFLEQCATGLDEIQHLYFAGGEPLLLSEHYALLEKLVALDRTDVTLAYNSNMSVLSFQGKSILELWKQFDSVWIEASVDAPDALGANMRSGFAWDTFVENVNSLRAECPHIGMQFGITVSIMNIMALPDLFDRLERECGATLSQMNPKSLQMPEFYRTQVLPKDLKRQAEDALRAYLKRTAARTDISAEDLNHIRARVTGLIDFMNVADHSQDFPQFAAMTQRLDALRHEDSASVFAGLEGVLNAAKSYRDAG